MRDIIVVGGGVAGLTAAAYLARSGYEPRILEKEPSCGGLVTSFHRDGFIYDGGIRATENSGILFPMLKQLGIEIEFLENKISLGIENKIIHIESEDSIEEYETLLKETYPTNRDEITEIISQIKKIMRYMDVQYGIKNPAFLDPREDPGYFMKKVLPWMFKYAITVPKIGRLNVPVVPFLEKYTQNQSLIDIITQHFFTDTPAYFALSYLKIYLDYYYPKGGTGQLSNKLVEFVQENGGVIETGINVTGVNPVEKYLSTSKGAQYNYSQLIWAADQNTLYNIITPPEHHEKTQEAIEKQKQLLKGKQGNNSVFTLYLGVDIPPSYFSEKNNVHFFYTPSKIGEHQAGPIPYDRDKNTIKAWLREFSRLTTYEISIPVLRDASLAPEGKTGLIISTLFDYHLTKHIQNNGWYTEFNEFHMENMIRVLDETIYPEVQESIIHRFSASPVTIEKRTGNLHGAITGWSFTNDPMPSENRLPKIFNSTETPVPDIVQAGHWTYSPSGLPISILTGKLAADRVIKNLKKQN